MIIDKNIPKSLTHDEQFEAIIARLNEKKSLIKAVIEAENVEEAIATSAPRPFVAVVWKDETNINPQRPKTLYKLCPQQEYRDWLFVIVADSAESVPNGIRLKDEIINNIEGWNIDQSSTPLMKVNAMYSGTRMDYACSAYSLRFRVWYTNSRSYNNE